MRRVERTVDIPPDSLEKALSPMHLITTRMAAEILGVTAVRVRQLIQQGQLASEKQGRDHLLCEDDVQRFNRHGRRPRGRPRSAPTK
jgi:site-specific DNA-methyltransferase (adenine-specific)